MRWGFVIGVLFICACSCSGNGSVPSNLIDQDKMGLVLWDVIQASQLTAIQAQKDSLKDPQLTDAKLQEQVFNQYKVTREDFYNSYDYYEQHPLLMQEMMDSLINRKERARRAEDALSPKSFSPKPTPVPTGLNIFQQNYHQWKSQGSLHPMPMKPLGK